MDEERREELRSDGPSGEPEPSAPSRRTVLERVLGLGAVIWAWGVAVPAAMYLWPARSRGPTRRYLEVDPASIPPGSGKVLASEGKSVLVLHLAGGEFRALSAVCTHLGCIVHWDPARGQVACPCHAAVFASDGSVVSGPPPRPLATYPSRIVAGKLRIEV